MSEIVTDSGADSAPTSTAEAAESVIDAFEATETTGSDTGDTAVGEQAQGQQTETTRPAASTAEEKSESARLLEEAGYPQKRSDGRENRIPWSKNEKIIANGLRKERETWTTHRTTLETEAQQLRQHIEQLRNGVAGDPRAFLEEIAGIDPRYRAFLEQQAATPAAAPVAEMPPPDIRLPDGSTTYSLAGIQKVLDWKDQQTEAKFDAKLKPFADRDKLAQDRQREEAVRNASREQYRATMEDAQTWPMFGTLPAADQPLSEVQSAILKELQDDSAAAARAGRRPALSLEGAYRRVVMPRMAADRNKVREEVLKELDSAPKGTAVSRSGGEAPRTSSSASTADIAARTLARLERAGG